jgi:2-furoate---CoA ligase
VVEVPRSPVGKLLRRKLVANEYEPEAMQAAPAHSDTPSNSQSHS